MFLKFFLFYLILRITGNPILAIIALLVIFYFVDKRYIGLLPSLTKPLRRRMRMSNLRQLVEVNPHDMPARLELAQTYIETRQYNRALQLLEGISAAMQADPEIICDTGVCHLALGRLESGEKLVLQALEANPRIHHGNPYLRLATAFAAVDATKALAYLEEFQRRNFSSCESFYRMAQLQAQLGDKAASHQALDQCLQTYRSLPRFRKRTERRWATLARLRMVFGG